ncbi:MULTISPECIES: S24 family peptidase [Croceibacter]|jgi:DNA polymerase V|uniref:SOS-response transcriptional repressors (RecA-mediatedautopeptidase)-like protein n=1 Tax=Croceibacter atlanticus (strain ATCC BAA-628 / JCM 21780 / CIP 108009 / IAM 15332 / KCTC 12090 / HTCC2559) TaxID=216432 RepID=A3U9K5_CROAH|nr:MULTISPECIES: S24 family peptidase [Croceibacter]HAT69181.1 peptidase S24 [Flavobacteriaceae bacterium]EAP86491.1 SOS-response transcriptional repressors (RecA-mediatedautopeptidase)-like protein [Croceibacter atlanticus HTCC2559]MAM22501.1 peptidase S24 [Croceibacter sp.]MBG26182.1 peptidase S24 [Croceibacter sp.]MBW4971034.1 peptidase S24 [Croceibacter atlanticus]|tara:strand:+ start:6469 stop:6834 length:366 start_codon:yes stop_codon:yes gene_type:complete
MEIFNAHKVQRPAERHQAEVSKQTGFPSPATHYQEAVIDLNKELIGNKDATFYVRIMENYPEHLIFENDVLIIDRSLLAKENDLALVIVDGEFNLLRIPKQSETNAFMLWGVVTYIIHAIR